MTSARSRATRTALDAVEFPLEHHAEILGGFEEQAAARSRVIAVVVAGLIAIFLLLQAAFASWRLAILFPDPADGARRRGACSGHHRR